MAFIRTTVDKAPKLTRVRVPRFEKTKEWAELRAALDQGLKPAEAVAVIFTERDMLRYRITNRRTVTRYVKQYLEAHKLPYHLKSWDLRSGGFNVVVDSPGPRK